MKRCGKCKEFKDESCFGISKKSKDGLRWDCKDCRKQEREANKEAISSRNKKRYAEDREKYINKAKKYYWETEGYREYRSEYDKQYRVDNADRLREKRRQEDPMPKRRRAKENKARRKGAEGTHAELEVQQLYSFQEGRCVYCSKNLDEGYHEDHWVPIILGGSNYIDNIQLLCPHCNLSKNSLRPEVYESKIKFNRVAYLFGQMATQHLKGCVNEN